MLVRAAPQESERRVAPKDSRTDVENSCPQVSHDHWWRTCSLLTNSEAAGANNRSLHFGHEGSVRRRIVAPDCVSICLLMAFSTELSPPSRSSHLPTTSHASSVFSLDLLSRAQWNPMRV